MATIFTPRSSHDRPSRASSAWTCFTYGQWLQMKATTETVEARSAEATVLPETVSGSENAGIGVPSASMVEEAAMRARSYCPRTAQKPRQAHRRGRNKRL